LLDLLRSHGHPIMRARTRATADQFLTQKRASMRGRSATPFRMSLFDRLNMLPEVAAESQQPRGGALMVRAAQQCLRGQVD